MVDIAALYIEELQEEYGFDIPQMEMLIEATSWITTDLNVDPDDYDTICSIVHGMAWAYKLGWDEGLDSA